MQVLQVLQSTSSPVSPRSRLSDGPAPYPSPPERALDIWYHVPYSAVQCMACMACMARMPIVLPQTTPEGALDG
jgi:hypothetical protein